MGAESEVETTTCEEALKLGVISVKMGRDGWPDRMFLISGGRPLFIEFKAPGEEPRKLQMIMVRRIRHYGYQVESCDNVQSAIAAIKKSLDAARIPKESAQVPSGAKRSGATLKARSRKD